MEGGSVQQFKAAVNVALDQLESAGFLLADLTRPGGGERSLTERLGGILRDLEQWKANAWEELERYG